MDRAKSIRSAAENSPPTFLFLSIPLHKNLGFISKDPFYYIYFRLMKRIFLFFLVFTALVGAEPSIVTIKPFFQFNQDIVDTYGAEIGYWPHQAFTNSELFLGYDFGLLTSQSIFEAYADAQIGSRIVGVSAGPYAIVYQGFHTGVQMSAWINLFAGFNFKYRWNPWDPMGSSISFYVALPLLINNDQ